MDTQLKIRSYFLKHIGETQRARQNVKTFLKFTKNTFCKMAGRTEEYGKKVKTLLKLISLRIYNCLPLIIFSVNRHMNRKWCTYISSFRILTHRNIII